MTDPVEPPNKKIKGGRDFIDLIDECYRLKFNIEHKSDEENEVICDWMEKIRDTIEQVQTSSDVSFGMTRSESKITWGKCLSLMLEDAPRSLKALKILNDRLSPGGGLLGS